MQRFVLRENVARFEKLLAEAASASEGERQKLRTLFASAKRDLALFDAKSSGLREAHTLSFFVQGAFERDANVVREFRDRFEASDLAYAVIDPRPGLHVIDVNEAFASATLARRDNVCGEQLFEAFPENPDHDEADGIASAYGALMTAAQTGQTHFTERQRYDVRDEGGYFVPSYWHWASMPILDDDGRLRYLLIHAESTAPEPPADGGASAS